MKDTFLTNVKSMVKDRGMSFRTFSLDIGIHRRTMDRWSFDRSPSLNSVIKIADYFQCSVDYLLDKSDVPDFVLDPNKPSFYERFSLLKKQTNFTDAQISALCDIAPSTITNWKHGSVPTFEILIRLCKLFDCSFDYLVGRSI